MYDPSVAALQDHSVSHNIVLSIIISLSIGSCLLHKLFLLVLSLSLSLPHCILATLDICSLLAVLQGILSVSLGNFVSSLTVR